jgi:predicted DNA-binding transcriptional regulator AlpA
MVRVMPYTDDRLLRRREVEAMVGFGRSMIYEKMASGAFPQPLKIGPTRAGHSRLDRQAAQAPGSREVRAPSGEAAWLAADRRESEGSAYAPGLPAGHIDSRRIEEAVRAAGGVMAHAAKMLGIARSTLYARLAVEPALREFREEVRDETIEIVESKLVRAALAGEPWAVRF